MWKFLVCDPFLISASDLVVFDSSGIVFSSICWASLPAHVVKTNTTESGEKYSEFHESVILSDVWVCQPQETFQKVCPLLLSHTRWRSPWTSKRFGSVSHTDFRNGVSSALPHVHWCSSRRSPWRSRHRRWWPRHCLVSCLFFWQVSPPHVVWHRVFVLSMSMPVQRLLVSCVYLRWVHQFLIVWLRVHAFDEHACPM